MASVVRGSCWSITINNPTESDLRPSFPDNRWTMTGQMEKGEEGTEHYQGMLKSPQVRFSAVKKLLPRAHIELAKNVAALSKYVSKQETRLAEVAQISNNIPTLFDYNHKLARRWRDDEFDRIRETYSENQLHREIDEIALVYIDTLVAEDIVSGIQGIEYIAINPMFRSAWKKFWRSMVARERIQINNEAEDINNASPSLSQAPFSSSPSAEGQTGDSPDSSHGWIYDNS